MCIYNNIINGSMCKRQSETDSEPLLGGSEDQSINAAGPEEGRPSIIH